MAKQLITIGTPGAGGGDPAYTMSDKHNTNVTEIYNQLGANGAGVLPTALPVSKGGTGATTAAAARTALGVIGVGDYGIGAIIPNIGITNADTSPTQLTSWYETWDAVHWKNQDYNSLNKPNWTQLLVGRNATKGILVRSAYNGVTAQYNIYGEHNTTVDGNGFIKKASPIVKLFADKIELNDEAEKQQITFEKLATGDYLVKGSLGFSQNGWYIEMPKDANGNVLVAVVYEQLENNDISVKTYAKRFDEDTGDIVPNLNKPRDIPDGRWIDLRLHEVKDEPTE